MNNSVFHPKWLPEPLLEFADGGLHTNPKIGIPLYGPKSLLTARHKSEIHVGIIGTGDGISLFQEYFRNASAGVASLSDELPFPGFANDRGFRSDVRFAPEISEKITRTEYNDLIAIRKPFERFIACLSLLETKLALLTQRDHPLDYVAVVLPDELYKLCRVSKERLAGEIVHRDLRRSFKAMAMKFLKPTQIVIESTIGGNASRKSLDLPSTVAWNLLSGLYFKVDGLPWAPYNLQPATCYIGVSFFRPLGDNSLLRTSVVQAFDENGEGLVLRGHGFRWDESKDGKSPHLTEELSGELVKMVLDRYFQERKQHPRRVVIHKTSRFEPQETKGFEAAIKEAGISEYDLLSLQLRNPIRILRFGQYPVLRGATFSTDLHQYLMTTGYIPSEGFSHGHLPAPIGISDHVGDTPMEVLLHEVLLLSKMNWNSAESSSALPISIKFSRLVGDILREVPIDRDPDPKYKFYM